MNMGHQHPTGRPEDGTFNGTLNVVVHGSVVFRASKPDYVELYMADLAHEHAYLAGSYPVETGLQKGVAYKLEGVPKQTPADNLGDNHIVLDLEDGQTEPVIEPSRVLCTILLPWPNEVHPLQLLDYEDDVLSNGKEQTIAGVTVFVYRGCKFGDLGMKYDGDKVLPWDKMVELSGHMNLHIFAEAPVRHVDETAHGEHLISAFNNSVTMIRNAKPITMLKPPTGDVALGTVPTGIHPSETFDLATRAGAVVEMFRGGLKGLVKGHKPGLMAQAEEACAGGMRVGGGGS